MMFELAGIEKQISECLASAYNKGYKAGYEAGLVESKKEKNRETELSRNIEEIKDILNCDVHPSLKLKMIYDVVNNLKPHYFKERIDYADQETMMPAT